MPFYSCGQQSDKIIQDIQEVKENINDINSNLDTLACDEIAGGKNILDITQNYKRYSNGVLSVSGNKITITGQWYCYYIIDVEENTDYFVSGNIDSSTVYGKCSILNEDSSTFVKDDVLNKTFNSGNNKKIAVLFYCGTDTSGTSVYSNIMIEKGTKATEYEPYIPSVKMLAEEVGKQNESLGEYDINENATGSYSKSTGFAIDWIKMCKATKGTYKLSYTINGSTGNTSEIALGKAINDKSLYCSNGFISDGIYEQIIDITSDTDVYIMAYTNGTLTISNIKFTLQNIANEVGNIKNDLSSLGCEIAFGDVDFNNLTNKMVYAINGTCTNAPKTTTPIHGILIVFKAPNDIISQLYHDSDGTLYNRMCWGGTWGSWK